MKKYKLKVAMGNILFEGSKQEMLDYMAYLTWEYINYYCSEYSSDNEEDENHRDRCKMPDIEIVGEEPNDIAVRISGIMNPGEVDCLGGNIEYSTPGVQMKLTRIDDNPIDQILRHRSGNYRFNYKGYVIDVFYMNFEQFRR